MNKEEKKAIEYIRKEFIEDYRRKQQRINKDAFQIYVDKEDIDNLEIVLKLIEMQTKELETYKKIAEKLAHYIWQYDCCEYEIGKNGKCEGYYIDKDCTEKCIIDWARKEVENEVS